MNLPVPIHTNERVTIAIEKWLESRYVRSQSARTIVAYRVNIASFRHYLFARNLDMDSYAGEVALHAQTWAGLRSLASKRTGVVSPATYNQRLATLSSFYHYIRQSLDFKGENPVDILERAKVEKYGKAQPLNPEEVKERLKSIDQSIPEGRRNFVLLQVALNTGRRAQELASLSWKHVALHGSRITLNFEHCKGNKTMYDELSPGLSKVLIAYIRSIYGERISPDSPLWPSFSDRTKGKPIGIQTIANICETYLGVSTVHSMRHTFAHAMEEAGASVSDIQARLGHESLATTGVYLAKLKRAYNPYAEKLGKMFGIDE